MTNEKFSKKNNIALEKTTKLINDISLSINKINTLLRQNQKSSNLDTAISANLPNAPLAYQKINKITDKVKHSPQIIVILNSLHKNIETAYKTLSSILNQNLKPDLVILWLQDEFIDIDLPQELVELKETKVKIKFSSDEKEVRVYKSLIYALKKYPDDILVTASDEIEYPENWLEKLYNSYKEEFRAYLHCYKATRFFIVGDIYKSIGTDRLSYPQPTYLHRPYTKYGVLYPPRSLHEDIFKKDIFMQLFPNDSDTWFWLMAIINGSRTKMVDDSLIKPKTKENLQSDSQSRSMFKLTSDLSPILEDVISLYPKFNTILKEEYKLMHKVELSSQIPSIEKDEAYYKNLPLEDYPAEIMVFHHLRTNKFLNLENPISLNEKIQWLKLYDSTISKSKLADKYSVREWIKAQVGEKYLIPIYGVWDNVDDIDFDALPDSFVLKGVHGWAYNIIVENKHFFDVETAKEKMREWLKIDFGYNHGLELHYQNIKPRIIAEKHLIQGNGLDLMDYKFLCFDGKPKYIWVDYGRYGDHRRDLFDLEWNLLPFTMRLPNSDKSNPKSPINNPPKKLDEMVRIVKILCKNFSHVRVDLYYIKEKIYFGEMTFTSGNGVLVTEPENININMGNMITLPKPKIFKRIS